MPIHYIFYRGKQGLKQSNKITYTHRKVVNIYIVYELIASGTHNNDPTLKKLFIWCSYFN